MYSLSIPSSPERQAFAKQLLKVLAVFGAVVASIDFLNGDQLAAAASALISVFIIGILYFARGKPTSILPLHFVIWLLLCMYIFGTVTHMPQHPEKAVWSTVFPFAFFYLAGLQAGLWLTIFSLAFTVITYQMYSWLGTSLQVTLYGHTQTVGAFVLCSIFAYLYEKVRTQQEGLLKQSAQCDSLTGLLNRRGFDATSDTVVQQALRSRHPLSVVLIDLDNFKQINDTQGHDAGDLFLKEISALLRTETRSSDLIVRWGGEEFLLLMQTDEGGARQLSEKIRSAIAAYQFSSGSQTASFGVAIHDPYESLEATIKRADQAMYLAKYGGKNKVEFLPSE
jgi:diguanylate cyclase (GGDEF)-like protein